MKFSLFTASIVWLATSLLGMAQSGQPRDIAPARTEVPRIGEAAPLSFWNREITVFRAYYNHLSPAQRAANAETRIEALPEATEWKVEFNEAASSKYTGVLINVNGQMVFGLMPEDLDPESGETLKGAGDHAAAQLRAALEARVRQRDWSLLLRSIGLSLAATLIALFGIWLVVRAGRGGISRLEKLASERASPLAIAGINLRPLARSVQRGAIRLTAWTAEITIAYLLLTFVLMRFPYSQPWGEKLGTFLINLFEKLGTGVVHAIPGVFAVLVISY